VGDHEYTATCYESIGNVFLCKSRYDDALIGYGKALSIRLRLLGENHTETATSYYNIGLVLANKDQFDQALENFRKAYAIYKEAFGENNKKTLDASKIIDLVSVRQENRRIIALLKG
jgi:tetratricopeptide (TPR) repeat protein